MMRTRRLRLAAKASKDLVSIYDRIVVGGSPMSARRFIDRLKAYSAELATASQRGRDCSAVISGLRAVGFEGRVTILFKLDDEQLTIIRYMARGRDWERELR